MDSYKETDSSKDLVSLSLMIKYEPKGRQPNTDTEPYMIK